MKKVFLSIGAVAMVAIATMNIALENVRANDLQGPFLPNPETSPTTCGTDTKETPYNGFIEVEKRCIQNGTSATCQSGKMKVVKGFPLQSTIPSMPCSIATLLDPFI